MGNYRPETQGTNHVQGLIAIDKACAKSVIVIGGGCSGETPNRMDPGEHTDENQGTDFYR
ncbi:hypothetical protein D3C81_1801450 [compost metagenome]